MEKYGFVYIWYDRKHKRYYIGSHWGTEDDGYICSSRWMRQSFRRRPEDFKRKILSNHITTKILTLHAEQQFLSLIKEEELGSRYYNLKKDALGGATRNGKKHSEETKLKMSEAHKGKILSEIHKTKISTYQKNKTMSEETKAKISKKLKGIKRSENTKEKMSKAAKIRNNTPTMKGKKHSEETKRKMSESARKRWQKN